MPKLTKRIVDAAEAKSTDYFIWCAELPGFGARIFSSGRKSYAIQYRANGATRRMAIGSHGRITTEEARKIALGHLGDVAKGGDPADRKAQKRAALQSMTVKDLCAAYLRDADLGLIRGKGSRPKKPSTIIIDRGRIARHVEPLIGERRVNELTPADIAQFIRDVTAGKTAKVEKTGLRGKAIVEGGAGTAARTAGLLGGILSFAVSEGVIPFNPARGVKRPADKRRSRRLTDDEYRAFGKALKKAAEEGETDQAIRGAWLIALTGCRLGEVERLQWQEVDEAGGCLRLIDSKEGASVRPVGRSALDVLVAAPKRKNCPFVLPSVRGQGEFGGMPGAWRRIAVRAGLEGVTPHTFRHSFASVAGDLGYAETTIAAMLGHSAATVTSRYIHHVDAVLIAAADRVAASVLERMTRERNPA